MLHLSNKEKKRKRKEILNNDLAILPSHDRIPKLSQAKTLQIARFDYNSAHDDGLDLSTSSSLSTIPGMPKTSHGTQDNRPR